MIAVFFVFRMRFYAAWCGAEAACISAGLGCYPEKALSKPGGGPTVNYRCFGCCLHSISSVSLSHPVNCRADFSPPFQPRAHC